MDSLESLDFSSFIIFSDDSDDPWSLLVSFRQLFKLPLVVQCCDVICEWPLIGHLNIFEFLCSITNIPLSSPGWTTCTWRVWLRCWRWCRGCTTPWPGTRTPARTTTCSHSSSPPIQTPPSGHGSDWVLKVSDIFLMLHGH